MTKGQPVPFTGILLTKPAMATLTGALEEAATKLEDEKDSCNALLTTCAMVGEDRVQALEAMNTAHEQALTAALVKSEAAAVALAKDDEYQRRKAMYWAVGGGVIGVIVGLAVATTVVLAVTMNHPSASTP